MSVALAGTAKKLHPKKSLADLAYGEIYRGIISLEFEPGSTLDEKALMHKLGYGRTPIREALLRLSSDMMVETNPSKGFFVRPITLQNTKAVFEALEIMELNVVSLAVKNDVVPFLSAMKQANEAVEKAIAEHEILALVESNYDFHMNFYRSSGNIYLVNGLSQVRRETKRLAYLSYSSEVDPISSLADHYHVVTQEHRKMIRLLEEHDDVHLGQVIHNHINAFRQRIIYYLTS